MPKEAKQMTKQRLDEIIAKGGASLTKTLEYATIKSGYLVSVPSKYAKVLTIKDDYDMILPSIEQMTNEINVDGLGAYVGLWVDEGKLYIDLSIQFNDRQVAINVGREFKQKAIYDVALDKVIEL
jgi:hypothetical protein